MKINSIFGFLLGGMMLLAIPHGTAQTQVLQSRPAKSHTIADYAVLMDVPSRFTGSKKTFSFTWKSPRNFVQGTNLARPLIVVDWSEPDINDNQQTIIHVLVNNKKVGEIRGSFDEGTYKRTIPASGSLFKIGANNTITLRLVKGDADLSNVALYYQMKINS